MLAPIANGSSSTAAEPVRRRRATDEIPAHGRSRPKRRRWPFALVTVLLLTPPSFSPTRGRSATKGEPCPFRRHRNPRAAHDRARTARSMAKTRRRPSRRPHPPTTPSVRERPDRAQTVPTRGLKRRHGPTPLLLSRTVCSSGSLVAGRATIAWSSAAPAGRSSRRRPRDPGSCYPTGGSTTAVVSGSRRGGIAGRSGRRSARARILATGRRSSTAVGGCLRNRHVVVSSGTPAKRGLPRDRWREGLRLRRCRSQPTARR